MKIHPLGVRQLVLIHAIPDFLREGLGNWKDVRSRGVLWSDLGVPVTIVRFDPERPESLHAQVPDNATDLLIEYSWWPEILETLKKQRPRLRLHVRTHNAEALQHLARSGWVCWPPITALRNLYGFVRLLNRDRRCRSATAALWGISPWDNRHYWSWLPGKAKIVDFPYFCPWPDLKPDQVPKSWISRPKRIISIPGGNDRIGQSMIDGFIEFVRETKRQQLAPDWNFAVSRGMHSDRSLPDDVHIDFLPEPLKSWEELGSTRALAVLGVRGYGLKTNVIDGLAAGCHVIVTPKMAAHLPDDVATHCLVCEPTNPQSVQRTWQRLQQHPVEVEACHARQRAIAEDLVKHLLGLDPACRNP